jgi:hypothetical protein
MLLMTRLAIVAFIVATAVEPALAQDPQTVAPQAYRTQLENDWVRVTRVHYAPHETIAEHEHPARPAIYVYLNDGGPVLFKHEHGESGDFAATRATTKTGAYRLAAGRKETHIVENRSALPSDFLQIELKTDVEAKTFTARGFRDAADADRNFTKVEFDRPELTIVRVGCRSAAACASVGTQVSMPTLLVAIDTGETSWLTPTDEGWVAARGPGEYLLIGLKQADRERRP